MPKRQLALHVNGDPRAVSTGCTVAGLIEELGLAERRVAIAINRDVVPHSAFGTRHLNSGDRVEILEAVGGG